MYDGRLMNEEIRAFVEGCDCVLGIGVMLTDFNSGAYIEVVTDKYAASPLAQRLHESLGTLYT